MYADLEGLPRGLLLQAAHRPGELLEKHNEGLICDLGLPLGAGLPRASSAARSTARGAWSRSFSRIFGDDRYYLEVQRHGIADQEVVNAELFKMSTDIGMRRWSRPTTPTTSTGVRPRAPRRAALHRHRRNPWTTEPLPLRRPRLLREGAGTRCARSSDHPEAVDELPGDRRALRSRDRASTGTYHMPEYQVPAGNEPRGRPRWREQASDGPARAPRDGAGRALHRRQARPTSSASSYELGVIKQMGFRRLLPDRRRLHRLREGSTASRSGPGAARAAGSLVGVLGPRHHRRRSDRVRHHLRALPQSRAHLDAGHRRRLLHERARPGDRATSPTSTTARSRRATTAATTR